MVALSNSSGTSKVSSNFRGILCPQRTSQIDPLVLGSIVVDFGTILEGFFPEIFHQLLPFLEGFPPHVSGPVWDVPPSRRMPKITGGTPLMFACQEIDNRGDGG